MATARTAMHYLVMAAFVCVTSQSAFAQSKGTTSKSTPVVVVSSKSPAKPKAPKTCLEVYNGVKVTTATLVSGSSTPASTLSANDLKNKTIQDALRATLLKVALVALSKLPPGKACDAVIAKIDAKFSRS
jgi:hypothetical protein